MSYLVVLHIDSPDKSGCFIPQMDQFIIALRVLRNVILTEYPPGEQVVRGFAVGRRQQQDLTWWYLGEFLDFK